MDDAPPQTEEELARERELEAEVADASGDQSEAKGSDWDHGDVTMTDNDAPASRRESW